MDPRFRIVPNICQPPKKPDSCGFLVSTTGRLAYPRLPWSFARSQSSGWTLHWGFSRACNRSKLRLPWKKQLGDGSGSMSHAIWGEVMGRPHRPKCGWTQNGTFCACFGGVLRWKMMEGFDSRCMCAQRWDYFLDYFINAE